MRSVVLAGIATGVLVLTGCGAAGLPSAAPTTHSSPAAPTTPATASSPPASSPPATTVVTPPPTPPPGKGNAARPVVYDCLGRAQTRPADFTLACADAGIVLTRVSWPAWSASGAAGSGQLGVNDCRPNCAEGKFGYTPVEITLSGTASGAGGPYFTRMALRGPGVTPQMRTWKLGTRGPGS